MVDADTPEVSKTRDNELMDVSPVPDGSTTANAL